MTYGVGRMADFGNGNEVFGSNNRYFIWKSGLITSTGGFDCCDLAKSTI